ncbi:copper amine oxidase [Clostridium aceticum]|uniref:Copper amine oxidase n=1 Tax=Clostridium aceticum TaxID=84022 RepID=A0A0G3WH84_9CLOT|nr:stalk domain-containing protein [Clostridium aceticum]AKL97255.1 copper amine oxidase [Clostridium aceticum]
MKKFISGLLVGATLMTGIAYATGTQIEVSFRPLKYYVEGVEKTPPADQAGFIYNGRTYVPLKFVSETLGKEVKWDGDTSSIYIGGQPQAPQTKHIHNYENGTYRGIFADRGDIQVSVEFKLENNIVTDINFRQLYHGGKDYRTEKEDQVMIGLREQHEQLIQHLVGKDIRESLHHLYEPGNIVTEDVDTFTGATLRAGKIISAVRDALNRGVYKY